jgi:hypothetical protein
MRTRSAIRLFGGAVATVAAGAFLALPALAEPPSHGHVQRPPRPAVEHPVRVHAPHAPHKPPPGFAPQTQDHPAHKPHPVLNEGPPKPEVVIHIRAPHKTHTVAPVVTVERPAHPRKTHVIVHSQKIVNKPPIVLEKRAKAPLTHPVKIDLGAVKH